MSAVFVLESLHFPGRFLTPDDPVRFSPELKEAKIFEDFRLAQMAKYNSTHLVEIRKIQDPR